MEDCFNNLVGIRIDCGEQVKSDSDLYIQDLPFINMKLANSINTDADNSFELLENKKRMATNLLLTDVRSRLAPKFEQASVLQNSIVGYYQENKPIKPAIPNTYKGIQIQTYNSGNYTIFISEISLFTDFTGSVPVVIIDLLQGRIIDTITVNGIANQIVTTSVFKEYKTNGQYTDLFIGYDSSLINSYTSYVYAPYGCTSCRPGLYSYRNDVIYAYSRSLPIGSSLTQNALTPNNDCGGLSIKYSVNCTIDKWLCQIRNSLSMPLLYKWGVEILKEAKITTRFNSIVALKRDAMEALQTDFETEYIKQMDDIFKNLQLPNDKCFKCNKRVRYGNVSL